MIHVIAHETIWVRSFPGFKRLVSLLLASCSPGFHVGHKSGALVNNSGAAVEMCWGHLNRLQGWMLRGGQHEHHSDEIKVNNSS